MRIDFGDQVTGDGHYLIENDGVAVASMAFNFDRKESDLRYFTADEIESNLEENQLNNATLVRAVDRNFSEVLSEIQNGKQLWKLCILLALFFILAEVLLIRFWK